MLPMDNSEHIFSLWASPPERVVADCPSLRYPSPTSSSSEGEPAHYGRDVGKYLYSLIDGQLQDIAYILVSVFDPQGLWPVSLPVAFLAFVYKGLRRNTSPLIRSLRPCTSRIFRPDIKGEESRAITVGLCLSLLGKEFPNMVEDLQVSDRVGAGTPAYRGSGQ